MRKVKKNTDFHVTLDEVIKANRRGDRMAEMELLGPGFHSMKRVHKSKKSYTRKRKHKGMEE